MKWLTSVVFFVSMCVSVPSQAVRLDERSDWWSLNNEAEAALDVKLQERNFDTDNFKILGLSLETVDFDKVASKLGRATIVKRGDASYSRSQACYVSNGNSEKVHLIFESGEGLSSTFYLFAAGADWKGSDLCVKSDKVSARLSTGTGLKLGLSRVEVEAILGKADLAESDRIGYCREFKGKADPVSIQVECRFTNNKLTYLFVSTTLQG